jgi:hypothetical protein
MEESESPREAIRAELEATRAAYHDLLARLSEADWGQPSANPAGTVGAVMAQVAETLAAVPRSVALARAGQNFSPPRGPTNAINTRLTRTMANRHTRATVGTRYDEGHAALLAALDGVADDEWERGATILGQYQTVADVFRSVKTHFDEQAATVAKALGQA